MLINYYVQLKTKRPFSQKFLKKIISQTAQELKFKKKFGVAVLLVGDKQIKDLNKKYRHKNKITDVLSFSQKEGEKFPLPQKEKNYLGEIIICYPQLKRQAKIFKQTEEKEFALLLIHGFLHLLGFDDQTSSGYKKMEKLQNKILARIYD
jgi:probable rRNA maturation factor